MESLDITTTTEDNYTLIKLSGSADMLSVDKLDEELDAILKLSNQKLVVEMKELSFICSMAIGSLIQAYKRCRDQEIEMLLAAVQPAIFQMLEAAQLNRFFNIVGDDSFSQ